MNTPVLWRPNEELKESCRLTDFANSLRQNGVSVEVGDYEALHKWSISNLDEFWRQLIEFFPEQVQYSGSLSPVRTGDTVETTDWFPNLALNYAEAIFSQASDQAVALIEVTEQQDPVEITWASLRADVAALRRHLIAADVQMGERVAAYVTNTREAIVGFLATASLGAVWTSCSPDFGAEAVLDRFEQLEPAVFIGVRSYDYGGKLQDRGEVLKQLAARLQTVRLKILIDRSSIAKEEAWAGWSRWRELAMPTASNSAISFARVPFGHPLWILFSSGTTGKPKAIVHGHGGCLLEHLKYLTLQADVREGERFFWFTTTGWMMWNFLQASMLVGAVPVLYDGSPGYPALTRLWRLASNLPIHHFGTSAPFLHACLKEDIRVAEQFDLSALRSIGSTGAPLSEDGFAYVYEQIKPDVWLSSMSGGTDVCTAFVGGNPWTPVRRGVIQGRALACDLVAYDGNAKISVGEVGELVVRQAMPSMPIEFWRDEHGERLHESYFSEYAGVWRHGDWITVDEHGGIVIHGRSDATLNRQGVRIGTAEVYRVVNAFAEVVDSVVINYVDKEGADHMPLFVKLAAGVELTEGLRQNIKRALREQNSPRHVPTVVEAVSDVPYTISGKRLEKPIKQLFTGSELDSVANLGALRNPEALQDFARMAREAKQ